MKESYELRQKLKISFSPRLISAVHVLEMSLFDLERYVTELADDNPLIELIEADDTDPSIRSRKKENEGTNELYLQKQESLYEHVYKQAVIYFDSPSDQKVLSYILYSLDNNGYFRENITQSAELLGVSFRQCETVLDRVRLCEPLGVGAYDLKDCLLIQARSLYPEDHLLHTLISDHLEEIAKADYEKISETLGIDEEDVTDCTEKIRTLNPRPSNGFPDQEKISYIIPDFYVETDNGQIKIIMNNAFYPKIVLSDLYEELRQTRQDKETKQYIKAKYNQYELLQYNLSKRNETLFNVAAEMVMRQKEFILNGRMRDIVPLKLEDIAQRLDIAVSTVSRAVNEKYFECRKGIYPLSKLLSKDLGNGISESYVKYRIMELIEHENHKEPLSDAVIVNRLRREDIILSRRTVAQYRSLMNIESSYVRKRYYKVKEDRK